MKKQLLMVILLFGASQTRAQLPIVEVIRAGIIKAIKAVDLKVQRLQNQTIWLQNAQKTVENTMSKAKLREISDWAQKQKDLYAVYYQELWEVKEAVAHYHRIRVLIQQQGKLVKAYGQALQVIRQDHHFSPEEAAHMIRVYAGILQASTDDLGQLFLAIHPLQLQMPDADRIDIVNRVAEQMDSHYADLLEFNQQNQVLSLQRSSNDAERTSVKQLYGLE